MEEYKPIYEYKDEILERFKEYNPIVHTSKEKDYDWLENDNCYSIEIKGKTDEESLFIDLEGELTLTFGDWHCHYYCDERSEYERAMRIAERILKSQRCSVIMFSNDKWYGSGGSNKKIHYTKEEALEYVLDFFSHPDEKEFIDVFKKHGVTVKFEFWDESKNYEYYLEKECFSNRKTK